MNYIDIILIVVCLLSVLLAFYKGFFHTLLDLFGKMASIVLAKVISLALCSTVYEKFLKNGISQTLYSKLQGVSSVDVGKSVNAALDSIPEGLNGAMTVIGVDKQELVQKVDAMNLTGDNFIQTILDEIVSPIAVAICKSLIFIGVIVVFSFILKLILKFVLKIFKKKPRLKKVDRLFGAGLGALRGFIIVVVLVYIIVLCSGFIGSQPFKDAVQSSGIVSIGENILKVVTGSVA